MKKWIYKHYKWKLYEVYWVSIHSETREKFVLYKCMYDISDFEREIWEPGIFFIRPYEMFNWYVYINWEKIKRFSYVKNP